MLCFSVPMLDDLCQMSLALNIRPSRLQIIHYVTANTEQTAIDEPRNAPTTMSRALSREVYGMAAIAMIAILIGRRHRQYYDHASRRRATLDAVADVSIADSTPAQVVNLSGIPAR